MRWFYCKRQLKRYAAEVQASVKTQRIAISWHGLCGDDEAPRSRPRSDRAVHGGALGVGRGGSVLDCCYERGFAVRNPANGLTICHDSAEEDAVLIADCTTTDQGGDRQTGTQTDASDD